MALNRLSKHIAHDNVTLISDKITFRINNQFIDLDIERLVKANLVEFGFGFRSS